MRRPRPDPVREDLTALRPEDRLAASRAPTPTGLSTECVSSSRCQIISRVLANSPASGPVFKTRRRRRNLGLASPQRAGRTKGRLSRLRQPFKACERRRSSLSAAIAAPGGARRDRTDDLMLAKHALSQLSYGPFLGKRRPSRQLGGAFAPERSCKRSTTGGPGRT